MGVIMNQTGLWTASLVLVTTLLLAGCGNSATWDFFEKIPGTDGVDVWYPSLSISPNGDYIVVLVDGVTFEEGGHLFDFQIESIDLRTGQIRRHRPSDDIDERLLRTIARKRKITGFRGLFREDSWQDGKFYIAIDRCVEIDPRTSEYHDISWLCPDSLISSDRIETERLAAIEKRFRESGALKDSEVYQFLNGNASGYGHLTSPAAIDRSMPVLYYVGKDEPGFVYRSDGKGINRVHKVGGLIYKTKIDQIKVSPDDRYLAVVRNKKLSIPVPVVSSGFSLTIIDLETQKELCWETSVIGSCVWAPDSKTLYITCAENGDGVYRLELSDVF